MITRSVTVTLVLIACTTIGRAGSGTWRNFTSMKDVASVAAEPGGAYWAATGGGLFGWPAGAPSFTTLTNAEGLQSLDLTAVSADPGGSVWIGSSTGVIDVYNPVSRELRAIVDIANDATHPDKRINNLASFGDTVFICTDFGLSVFFRQQFQFGDTYTQFGTIPRNATIAAFGAAIYNGRIWASISDGQVNNYIASASLSSPNLLQPASWSLQNAGPPTAIPKGITVFHGSLYAGTSAGMYVYNGTSWNAIGPAGRTIVGQAGGTNNLYFVTSVGEVFSIDTLNTVTQFGGTLPFQPTSVTVGRDGQPAVGCLTGGVLTYQGSWTSHFPNGPNSNQFSDVVVDNDGVVWGASGQSSGQGFYRFDGKTWMSFTRQNSPLPANEVYRVSVACDGSLWGSTWGSGVVEIPHGTTTLDSTHVFNTNVGMAGIPSNPSYVVITNVVCDSRGNNWMAIVDAADHDILVVHRPDGSWVKFPAILGGNTLHWLQEGGANPVQKSLAIDAYDNLWAVVRDASYGGVVSLWNGGTIDSTVRVQVIAADGLPSDEVNTILVDRDNNIWVGTDKGIGIIVNPLDPKGPGGIAAYKPLNGLAINAIAVDPLNQKWVGTTEGVVLLSPDGTQELASYTVESTGGKLIDNNVKSIAVDPTTGTVYFATAGGLASLTTPAAAPRATFDKLVVYPNPYRIPASIPLTVDGLTQNASLKILSIDGRLVRELKTPGGRVGFWDGKDPDGNDVSSGIYLVVAYSEDGSSVVTGKVAVLKK